MSPEFNLEMFENRDWQSTTEGEIRFALIGLGWWTVEKVIPAIERTDLCETTVLVSSDREKATDIASNITSATRGITYDEFHDGVAVDDYDAVYICTPNAYHLEYAQSAAEYGKHVLCEKPMEATSERAAKMVDVCIDHDVELLVGYRMQTEPAVRRARELIRNGRIGKPRYVHGANTQRLLDIIPETDQWRLDHDLTGYGTSVMDLGIYPLNTARFLLDADPVSVQATMRSDHSAFNDVPDEHASFSVTLENDVFVVCTASQNAANRSYLEITGTRGSIRLDPAFHMETTLSVTIGGDTVTVDTTQKDQMTELFDYVGHTLVTDRTATLDGEHGLVDIQTIEAIHEASASGRRVQIDGGR